ncbi:MarR family winged helix-turn-helix transcriptional regulator [Pseudooceanicola sp. 502str34]|uniref:MarR family winged helix-turn-helix transcriptional regulator n=1 Tax=Maritimibacter alkaliphilus TaxID=404236 RepID=UPI001C95B435|nr:MarR family winged helix-turn-helix transcriptional regulator [Maritimibacter alkaliphilus]MBY6088935.1 MarR family winged helix-turn-helix transcriptional regulator [Maritimibacter alkaliphilus]
MDRPSLEAPSSELEAFVHGRSVFARLITLNNLISAPFHARTASEVDLTLNEWRVILVINALPGVTARQICDVFGMNKMNVSRAIASLQKKGHVEQMTSPGDQRSKNLVLQPSGKEIYRAIIHRARKNEERILSVLDPSEIALLNTTLDKLLRSAHDSADALPSV